MSAYNGRYRTFINISVNNITGVLVVEKLIYDVYVTSLEQHEPLYSATFNKENKAVDQAELWAEEHKENDVFIRFHRSSDGQTGYVNRDGVGITGKTWVK